MCMSAPKPAPVTAPPPAVQEQDATIVAKQKRSQRRMQAMTGYQGTVLTGPTGDVGKTVLGG